MTHTDVKLLKNTVLGLFNRVKDVDHVKNYLGRRPLQTRMQTQLLQSHNLKSSYLLSQKKSSFQIHTIL